MSAHCVIFESMFDAWSSGGGCCSAPGPLSSSKFSGLGPSERIDIGQGIQESWVRRQKWKLICSVRDGQDVHFSVSVADCPLFSVRCGLSTFLCPLRTEVSA